MTTPDPLIGHEADALGENADVTTALLAVRTVLNGWHAARTAMLHGLALTEIDALDPESGASGPEIVDAAAKVYDLASGNIEGAMKGLSAAIARHRRITTPATVEETS